MSSPITEQELTEAGKIWGDALVVISKYMKMVVSMQEILRTLPFMVPMDTTSDLSSLNLPFASGEQIFRPTREGALSYFVGQAMMNTHLMAVSGIKGWRMQFLETSASFIQGDVAMWMGWVTFTDKDGNVTKVDKSWGYKKDEEGMIENCPTPFFFALPTIDVSLKSLSNGSFLQQPRPYRFNFPI